MTAKRIKELVKREKPMTITPIHEMDEWFEDLWRKPFSLVGPSLLSGLRIPHEFDLTQFEELIDEYEQIRGRFLGFLFKRKRAREQDLKFKKTFPYLSFKKPHKRLRQLKKAVEVLQYAAELKENFSDKSTTTASYLHYVIASIQLDTRDEIEEVSDHVFP